MIFKRHIFSVIIAVILFLPLHSFAETKEIISEGTYNMGDGETPGVAESRALLQAKRIAIEQAGTYVESYTKVKNLQLTEDEIKVLASGIVEVEILDKKRTVIGDGIRFWIKIKAKVNPDKIEDMAKKVKEKSVVEDYKKIGEAYDKSQREIEELRKQLAQTKDEVKRRQIVEKIINDESLFQANDWFEKGKKLGLDGKYDESIEALTAAITLNPIHAEAYNGRGVTYADKGQYEKAFNDFSKAIAIDSNLFQAYTNRGITYFKRHHYDKALEDFNKAIALEPNFAKAYYLRGAAYTNLNSIKSAISDFQKACDMGDADGCKALRDSNVARFMDDSSAKRTNIITIPLSQLKLSNLITQNKILKGHSNYVYSVAFDRDARMLASGSADKNIILWDTPIIHLSSLITIRDREADISGIVKSDYETSKEYEARIKKFADYIKEERDRAEEKLKRLKDTFNHPYSFRINNIGKYDADKGGFEADIFGNKVLIPIPREKAIYISNHEDNLIVTGTLSYFDSEKVELVNAFLVDKTTNEQFPFGRHTE